MLGHGQLGHAHHFGQAAAVLVGGPRVLHPPRGHGDPDLPGQLPVHRAGRGQKDPLDLPEQRDLAQHVGQGDFGGLLGPG